MNDIQKAANKLYKQLKGDITFETVEVHLKKLGYKIIFFHTAAGDAELQRYCLTEKAQNTNAFTYCATAKIVFINNRLSVEDKFYLLLHETAHILLRHLEPGRIYMRNSLLLDIDADAFVHYLLNPQQHSQRNVVVALSIVLLIVLLIVVGLAFYGPATKETTNITVGNGTTQSGSIVYITSSGKHFHTANCGAISGKVTARIERNEALRIHTPCKTCNP